MEAARTRGYHWPTTCGGEARCTTCLCRVEQGADNLSAMGRAERTALTTERGAAALAQSLRLACQARLYGDVEVYKEGVLPPL